MTTITTAHSTIDHTGLTGVGGGGGAFVGCYAYHDTTQSFSENSWTNLSLNSEKYDTSAFHDNSTNNTRLTMPSTGYYRITGGTWLATTSGTNYLAVNVDGSTVLYGSTTNNFGSSGIRTSVDVHLTAGQYIELMAYHTQSGSLAAGDTGSYPGQMTFLSAVFLGT